MSFSLGAKRVLITGASAGIGAAVAREFAAAGAAVGICARRGERLDQVLADCQAVSADPGSCRRWVVDLARLQGISAFARQVEEELGPVDVLVNNAGYAVWKPLEATTTAEWDHTFAVNVRAAACLCAAVLPGMQERGFGRIINIGSEAGVAIVPGLAAYCVSKHALRALTEVIQEGNHGNGIKAWVICPGFVDTEMGYVVPGGDPGSFLRVDEVVDVARFLLRTGDNVKLGPEILVRTMRNPMAAQE